MSAEVVIALAEQIKETGQNSANELPELLKKAEDLAHDEAQDVLTRALAHRAAGNARQLLNQFQPALESYNSAAALLETLDEPVELGRTLHAKVGMLFTLSRFDELFECSAHARRLFERCSDRKRLARLDVNLAHAYHRLGRPTEALECSERALRTLEEIQDREGFVAAAINSAVTLTAMHEFERAEERYRAAMDTASESHMSSWVLLSRYNLAYLQYLRGETAVALNELQLLKQEYERTNEEWMICHCWLDESEILLEIGDLKESIAAARRARSIAQKLGLNTEIGKSFLYEAAAGMRLDQAGESGALLDEAARRFAADENPIAAAAAKLQTALLRSENGDETALDDAVSARSLLHDSGLPHLRALAETVIGRIQRGSGNLDAAIDSFKSGLSLAEHSRSHWMQFHAAYELGVSLNQKGDPDDFKLFVRADGLLDSLWNRLGSDDLKMSFLGDRENVYTYLVRKALTESAGTALDYSEKARSRVLRERLLGADARLSTRDLASRLSKDESVVEYFVDGDDLCIFVLRYDDLICVRRPGIVTRLRQDWQDLDRHIESCSVKWEHLAPVHQHLEATARRHLSNFYEELIRPIESELRGTVIIVPHGFLHAVPLHALYDGDRYVAERFQIGYTPSASLYSLAPQPQEFAGPLFVAFATSPASTSVAEVEEASALMKGSTLLVNPSIDELRHAFGIPRVLVHIAGHAGIDAISGRLSWIETANGRLTSRDLADMQIRARTILITGCQTARRIIQPGDEWLGLMRSFYLSGASTIVSALWDIRDETARHFAREFHKVFNGSNALQAVQRAAARVREMHTHPYFWAGFGAFVRKAS